MEEGVPEENLEGFNAIKVCRKLFNFCFWTWRLRIKDKCQNHSIVEPLTSSTCDVT